MMLQGLVGKCLSESVWAYMSSYEELNGESYW